MIVNWIVFITTLLIGYILGRLNGSETPKLKDIKRSFAKIIDTSRVGAVNRPSAEYLDRKENPKKYEEEDEMRKAFNNLKVNESRTTK